ncbi:MAG: OmpH family outer membrane protein [Treponema sp.]|nr:OmpH family outer membrane protein [Treponema sp.]
MKKIIVLSSLFAIFASSLFCQQITKFGVVDTSRVYNAYFRNSSAVRNYERKKADYQEEINKRTQEIRDLQQRKLRYQEVGDESNVLRVESEITRKTEYLTEYTNAKNVELSTLQKSLQNSDAFYKRLYTVLAKVAESGGYSMILSLQQANAILWYSTSVDVTDLVIAELGNN